MIISVTIFNIFNFVPFCKKFQENSDEPSMNEIIKYKLFFTIMGFVELE